MSKKHILSYEVSGTLEDALKVAVEVNSEMGMIPGVIANADNEVFMKWDEADAVAVSYGRMSAEEYFKKHQIFE